MKYKIQTATLWGWSDLKTSVDGGEYEVETFVSIKDAQDEIDMIVESLEEGEAPESYRVVERNTPQDVDLYD
jgi:hypothetical protein